MCWSLPNGRPRWRRLSRRNRPECALPRPLSSRSSPDTPTRGTGARRSAADHHSSGIAGVLPGNDRRDRTSAHRLDRGSTRWGRWTDGPHPGSKCGRRRPRRPGLLAARRSVGRNGSGHTVRTTRRRASRRPGSSGVGLRRCRAVPTRSPNRRPLPRAATHRIRARAYQDPGTPGRNGLFIHRATGEAEERLRPSVRLPDEPAPRVLRRPGAWAGGTGRTVSGSQTGRRSRSNDGPPPHGLSKGQISGGRNPVHGGHARISSCPH